MNVAGGDRLKATCITVLGSGYMRPASATWASALCVLLFAGLWWVAVNAAGSRALLEAATVAGILAASVLSVRWGSWAIAHFKSKDPKSFVLDEFAGQWLALVALPVATGADWPTLGCALLGQFILFRVMDISKPPPARQLEALPAGWGILCDDLCAGLFANVVGQLVWRLTPLAARLGLSGI